MPSSLRFSSAHTVLLYSGFGFFSLLFSDSKTCPSEATFLLLAGRSRVRVRCRSVAATRVQPTWRAARGESRQAHAAAPCRGAPRSPAGAARRDRRAWPRGPVSTRPAGQRARTSPPSSARSASYSARAQYTARARSDWTGRRLARSAYVRYTTAGGRTPRRASLPAAAYAFGLAPRTCSASACTCVGDTQGKA